MPVRGNTRSGVTPMASAWSLTTWQTTPGQEEWAGRRSRAATTHVRTLPSAGHACAAPAVACCTSVAEKPSAEQPHRPGVARWVGRTSGCTASPADNSASVRTKSGVARPWWKTWDSAHSGSCGNAWATPGLTQYCARSLTPPPRLTNIWRSRCR